MKKIIVILCLLISPVLLAQEITKPTEASKPLPTLSETNNPDTVLTEKVQKRITDTPALKDQSISAVSADGVVTLQGSVETKNQESAAIIAAKSVTGVKEVKSQLTIKAP